MSSRIGRLSTPMATAECSTSPQRTERGCVSDRQTTSEHSPIKATTARRSARILRHSRTPNTRTGLPGLAVGAAFSARASSGA